MSILTRKVNNSQNEEDKLLEFVNEQIDKFKTYMDLGGEYSQPGFYELTEALKSWAPINYSLMGMNILAKRELGKAKNNFEEFMAEKYMEQRRILNPPGLSASKFASSKEIEYSVINNYKTEYEALNKEVEDAEMKVAFIRRLQDSWQSNLMILNRLCKNVDTETIRLGSDTINV